MAFQIVVNQAGKSAGVAGRAREDISTGTAVSLSISGGPFSAYLWSFVSRPIDVIAAVRSSAALSTPQAASTLVTPIDVANTYYVQALVDSGSGLGAKADDVQRITFAALPPGVAYAADPRLLPRRVPAFGERAEHNAPDAIDATGNRDGWSREMARWFAVVGDLYEGRLWAGCRAHFNTGTGLYEVVRGYNVASVTSVGGAARVTFQTPLPDALWAPHVTPVRGDAPGNVAIPYDVDCTASRCDVFWIDETQTPVDSSFAFRAELGV